MEPDRLSRDQLRVVRQAIARIEPLAFSAITLIEIAVIREAKLRSLVPDILGALAPGGGFQAVPIDTATAAEIYAIGDSLRDPSDRAIVATARVHGLRLVTSDQRIIASKLVPVVA